MNLSKALCSGIIVLSGAYGGASDNIHTPKFARLPVKLLSSEFAHKYARKLDTIVDYQFAMALASTYGDEQAPEALEYIVLLWCQGFRRPVELLWFEKDDRISRTLIMLLVLADKEDDMLDSYIAKCNRFAQKERDQRREEICFVAEKRDEHARLVKLLMKRVRALEDHKRLSSKTQSRRTDERAVFQVHAE